MLIVRKTLNVIQANITHSRNNKYSKIALKSGLF